MIKKTVIRENEASAPGSFKWGYFKHSTGGGRERVAGDKVRLSSASEV
ncbi:hypothetical protein LAUMK191_04925 [Mycobacterium attenuatum]|uniref:Uncharacterized protein n=1 Tax=Mycobacterium attenuatum TaxID=2341086 RepID=A0A498QF69_9MYCO|nr:hypothetical protein LAUMK136_04940 [Mycobacterium attenuatum]VBA59260.1 hypothetical protein LAUMK191_04925 [Mycobacterium attenuatum]VBA61711.1 hypothetical protein LAUMK41_05093 [Mycobacterium attenuatum]